MLYRGTVLEYYNVGKQDPESPKKLRFSLAINVDGSLYDSHSSRFTIVAFQTLSGRPNRQPIVENMGTAIPKPKKRDIQLIIRSTGGAMTSEWHHANEILIPVWDNDYSLLPLAPSLL